MTRSPRLLPRRRARQRGALLLEASLAVGVAVSLVGLTLSISQEQQRRADAVILAGEKRMILDAARSYVRDNKGQILEELFGEAQAGGAGGAMAVDLETLIDSGYLASAFTPGAALNRITGQEYALLMRSVFQSDADVPAATLTEIDMDPLGAGEIDPRFIDGNPDNEELGIEAVLFTTGGDPVPLGMAGRTIDAVERINAAFIHGNEETRGSGGTLVFNVSGFAAFDAYDDIGPGRFASPVSLGSVGVLGDLDGAIPDLREMFLRCVGMDSSALAYTECLNAPRNQVYGNIVLRPYDSDDSGDIDAYPAITGATRILCLDADGNEDDPVDPDVFLIDCQTTEINGVLDVTGSAIRFADETLVETREIDGVDETVIVADRVALRLPSGDERDLSENVFMSFPIAARDTYEVQECQGTALDGSELVPTATASVAAAVDPWGRSVSGVYARAERGFGDSSSWLPSDSGDHWMARIFYTVEANFCEASFSDPIDIRDTFSGSLPNFVTNTLIPNIPGRCASTPPGGSTSADIYEIYPVGSANYGIATMSISCGLPPAP